METSRLTRDGTSESVATDQILRGADGDREKNILPVELTTVISRFGSLTRLIHVVVVVVVVFTLKAVPVSTQYFLTSVLVQLTRTPSVVTG